MTYDNSISAVHHDVWSSCPYITSSALMFYNSTPRDGVSQKGRNTHTRKSQTWQSCVCVLFPFLWPPVSGSGIATYISLKSIPSQPTSPSEISLSETTELSAGYLKRKSAYCVPRSAVTLQNVGRRINRPWRLFKYSAFQESTSEPQ